MFGIISCEKEKVLEKWGSVLGNNIPGEFFECGFLSIFSKEDTNCFLLKDNLNRKIIIFEGKLYVDNYEINPRFDKEKISEILFSLYLKRGLDFLSYLKGEFILGLWDENERRFLLARDKLTGRHIYYSVKDNLFIFSSEINYFYRYDFIEKGISLDALNLYFSFKFTPSPYTIFKGISKLPSASFVIWEKGTLYTKKYWEVNIDRLGKKRKFESDVAEVERLIKKSIERRISRSRNICSYLSGGMDTSTIVSVLATFKEKNLSVFCARDESNLKDTKCARLVAKHFKIDNYYEKVITWSDMIGYLPKAIEILEEPTVDPTVVYLYLINGWAKNYGDIILGGEGGDQIFGTNRYYYLLNLVDKISFIYPKKPLDLIAKFTFGPSFRYRLLALRDSRNKERSLLDIISVFPIEDREKIFTDKVKKKLQDDLDIEILNPYFRKSDAFIDLLMKFDIENKTPDMYLMENNKLAGANCIEHSAIFLDEDLIEYIFTISKSNIFNIMDRRIIQKKILERLGLPRRIIYRKKSAFVVPTGEWLNKGLNKWMRELLSYKNISAQGFFNFSQIDKIFRFAEKDLRAQWQLWSLAIFTLWFKIFISNEDVS